MNTGRRRVWVTGTGIVSALGDDMAAVWTRLRAGQTGIAGLRMDGLEDFRCRIGAQVDDARLEARLAPLGPRPGDRALECAMVATEAALREAGLPAGPESPPQNMPVLFGTGIGSTESYMDCITAFGARGPRGLRPTSIPRCMANAISARISMRFRLTGANYAIVSACTSATNAIGIAFRMVRDGYVDRALCGGTDATFDPFLFGGWNSLGVLARGADPARACRPFDRDRDGCVLGEGAGALVLEAADVAAARGARPLGELLGYGESSDAGHITRPSVEGQAAAISAALACAELGPAAVGYISAHGTATRANDECECAAIRAALGAHADRIPTGSMKSYFGHTLGASGAIEAIATLTALRERHAPGNLNLDNRDPACGICLVGPGGETIREPVALKNSFGFGGGNGVLVLGAPA